MHERVSTARQLTSLTGLRGVAAIWVLGFHFLGVFDAWGWNLGFLRAPLEAGFLGVDLFFALSGFVIAHAYTRKMAATPRSWATWSAFLYRRFARMYPVHLFVILVLLAGIAGSRMIGKDFAEGADYSLGNLLRHLLLAQVWLPGGSASWNAPSWSIHAEWFAYACFPLLAPALQGARSARKLLAVGGLGYLALIAIVELSRAGHYDSSYDLGIFRCAAGFGAGACLWRCWTLLGTQAARLHKSARMWPFVVAGLLFLDLSPAIILPALALLVPSLAIAGESKLLDSGPLQYLGRISYALYMSHHVVLIQLGARLPGHSSQSWYSSLVLLCGYFLAIVVVAHLVYTYLEEPMRRRLLSAAFAFRKQLAQA